MSKPSVNRLLIRCLIVYQFFDPAYSDRERDQWPASRPLLPKSTASAKIWSHSESGSPALKTSSEQRDGEPKLFSPLPALEAPPDRKPVRLGRAADVRPTNTAPDRRSTQRAALAQTIPDDT